MFVEKEQEFAQNTWKPPGRPVDGPQLARVWLPSEKNFFSFADDAPKNFVRVSGGSFSAARGA
jgi:hypothetical protein